MAEFQEVMRQWRRMCADGKTVCRGLPDEDEAKTIEGFVMAWAAEHPEPVYETWGQYFRRYYGLEYCKGHEMLLENIPADIAQKLGLQPKEGT